MRRICPEARVIPTAWEPGAIGAAHLCAALAVWGYCESQRDRSSATWSVTKWRTDPELPSQRPARRPCRATDLSNVFQLRSKGAEIGITLSMLL
jgi:hypothetical protein